MIELAPLTLAYLSLPMLIMYQLIWDADFEKILEMNIPHVIAGGVRHLKYSSTASNGLSSRSD